jgi:hypothetical protein
MKIESTKYDRKLGNGTKRLFFTMLLMSLLNVYDISCTHGEKSLEKSHLEVINEKFKVQQEGNEL